MKHFTSTSNKKAPLSDDQITLYKITAETEKYRARLIGEMKLFDLNVCLKLAELNRTQMSDKKKTADFSEFIKLIKDEIKYMGKVTHGTFKGLEDFEQALFSNDREKRIKRLNQLMNKVLGTGTELNDKIEKNSKADKELEKLKEKIAAVVIVINILNSKDSDESKILQITYHAKNANKRDNAWNDYWKNLQFENMLAAKKSHFHKA